MSPVLNLPAIPRRDGDPAAHRELIKAVAAINRSELLGEDGELTFLLDRESHRPVLRIVDRVSREVISEISGEEVLRLAEQLRLLALGGGQVG